MKEATRNQLGNCKNQYQGSAKRVLCVCSAGLLRSPTLAALLNKEYGFNTRACGIAESYALILLSHQLLEWADEVYCMDDEQRSVIQTSMTMLNVERTPIHVLSVRDIHGYGDEKLIDELRAAYENAQSSVNTGLGTDNDPWEDKEQ